MRMHKFITYLVLVMATIGWAVAPVLAQSKSPAQPPGSGKTTLTDGAGRVHVRGPRITYAQRKSAAEQRVKKLREAAIRKQSSGVKK